MKLTFALLVAVCLASPSLAAEPTPPQTQLCQPTKLISHEQFDQASAFAGKGPGVNGWRAGIGEWTIVDGAAVEKSERPSEKRPNGHEAVCEHVTDLGDLVLSAEFRLGTSPQVGFVCRDTNQPNHHLGRVVITPTAIWIQKMSGIAKETRREELIRIAAKVDPEAWHTVTVEVCGDRWNAQIDDVTIEAEHERFADRKGRVGFVARGDGAQFRNVKLYEARPIPNPSAAGQGKLLRGALDVDLAGVSQQTWTDVSGKQYHGKLLAVTNSMIMIEQKKTPQNQSGKLLLQIVNLSDDDKQAVQEIVAAAKTKE
ncbi:family 16 glycoside hydrolase [Blastopirellula marina]|nr:family 16 glycoside hydrolase [Blastopirellula marina]